MQNNIQKFKNDVVDSTVSLDKVMREGYVIAQQQKDKKRIYWIYNELNGYKGRKNIPEYRFVKYQLAAGDHGEIYVEPLPGESAKLHTIRVNQSIASIEDIINSKNKIVGFSFTEDENELVHKLYGHPEVNFVAKVLVNNLIEITSQVRNELMNWAVSLPDESSEKNIDHKIDIHIDGDANNTQFQIGNTNSKQTFLKHLFNLKFIAKLGDWLKKLFGN